MFWTLFSQFLLVDNVQHFGPLKTYLLSGSDREIFS